MTNPTISLQLYTVRDQLAQDSNGTLETIARLGYQGVEGSGFGNSEAFLAKIEELGLKFTGGHVGLGDLQNDLDAVIAESKKIGNCFIIVPWVGQEWRGSQHRWAELGALLGEIGMKLAQNDLTLCYHHHDFEISERFGSKTALDVILENAPSEFLKAEIDVYWVKKGGGEPVEMLQRYSGRVPLVHLKDMSRDGQFAEVGAGTLDFKTIFAVAEAGGAQVYAVEQDTCPGNPLDSIAISIENLRKMGKI